jgi:uncharacterized membrane protein YedE/YeeE
MRNAITRHWSYLPTGVALAVVLMAFWAFNQGYLGPEKGVFASFLENPLPTFVLVIFGAYIAASMSGEFSVKAPVTFEPLILSLGGGIVAGVGAVVAGMSVHSTVLFNLAGVFTLPAFMITKGWIYIAFMVAGGAVASRLLLLVILKTGRLKREIVIPQLLDKPETRRIIFLVLLGLFAIFVLIGLLLPWSASDKTAFIVAILLLVLFGFIVERGTVCMSSMLKEWFISHTAYVWRSVLFAIMCLAVLYQIGLQLSWYEPIKLEVYISDPALLTAGSFLMGFGFVFADGCFIGSLWKVGQGNVINVAGVVGLLMGMGGSQMAKSLLSDHISVTTSPIPNYVTSLVSPLWLLVVLWVVGTILLVVFKQKRYRY